MDGRVQEDVPGLEAGTGIGVEAVVDIEIDPGADTTVERESGTDVVFAAESEPGPVSGSKAEADLDHEEDFG